MPDRVLLPQHELRASLRADSFDEATNSIELLWTTGAAVLRWDWDEGYYMESLDLSPKAVRLERMNAGASFLNSHSSWDLADVIGRVLPGSANVDGKQGLCRVGMSVDPAKAGIVADVRAGIIGNVSVGYIVHAMEWTEGRDGAAATCRVTDWEPFEVSAVPVPADFKAQTRAADGKPSERGAVHPCIVTRSAPRGGSAPPVPQPVNPPSAAARLRRALASRRAGL